MSDYAKENKPVIYFTVIDNSDGLMRCFQQKQETRILWLPFRTQVIIVSNEKRQQRYPCPDQSVAPQPA